jgi:HAD superfamily hydrolase (TIGR01509 family)
MAKAAAFLFDLDGTLMDSEVLYVEATREALKKKGHLISREQSIDLVYGKGWSVIWADVGVRYPGAYEKSEEMEQVIREAFLELRKERDIRIPGSVKLLRALSRDYPVAIVSGSPREDVQEGVDLLGVGSDIVFFMGSEDYYSGKPDPTCFLVAAERLKVQPVNCVVFEDSAAGVTAAKRAGMYCVGLQRKGAPLQDFSLADEVLEDLAAFDVEGIC